MAHQGNDGARLYESGAQLIQSTHLVTQTDQNDGIIDENIKGLPEFYEKFVPKTTKESDQNHNRGVKKLKKIHKKNQKDKIKSFDTNFMNIKIN